MSKVISFNRPRAKAFLADLQEAQHVNTFGVSNLVDGAMVLPQNKTSPRGLNELVRIEKATFSGADANSLRSSSWSEIGNDWSNQELADLYRAQRLLNMAGITIDVDRGLTDEGEPWFVFVDKNDDVFIHFCRIDGSYLLDSPAQEAPIMGCSLETLISGFVGKSQPVSAPARKASTNVVNFQGQKKVQLHPGAALAALVWAIYLMSDDLVLPATNQTVSTGSILGSNDEVNFLDASIQPLQTTNTNIEDLNAGNLEQLGGSARATLQSIDDRSANANSNQLSNTKAIGLGLSTLALSYGLDLWETRLESSNFDAVSVSETKILASSQRGTADSFQISEVFLELLGHIIDQFEISVVDVPMLEKHSLANVYGGFIDLANMPLNAVVNIIDVIAGDVEIATSTREDVKIANMVPVKGDSPNRILLDELGDSSIGSSSVSRVAATSENMDATIFHGIHDLEVFLDLHAVGNFDETVLLQLGDDLSDMVLTGTPVAEGIHLEIFDDEARMFVDFLLAKYESIKMLSYASEIILMDLDAFDANVEPVYAKSWVFEDGGIISTIGLLHDYEAFNLVA